MARYANVYIDGDFFDRVKYSLIGNSKVNIRTFAEGFARKIDCDVRRVYYFHALPYMSAESTTEEKEAYNGKQKFFDALRRNRIEVRLGHVIKNIDINPNRPDFQQKGVDIYLAIETLTDAFNRNMDELILISGDDDFVPLMERIKMLGIMVKVSQPPVGSAGHRLGIKLKTMVDDCIELTKKDFAPYMYPSSR